MSDAFWGISGNRDHPHRLCYHGVAVFPVIGEMLMPLGYVATASLAETDGGNSMHDELARGAMGLSTFDSRSSYNTEFLVGHRRITDLTVDVTKKKAMMVVCRSYSAGESGSVMPMLNILSHTISFAL